ncbi:MAG: nonstructural protein [Arizlama microvirus]|nr:MAG: nonstructural protein [Arizlama microvirus]
MKVGLYVIYDKVAMESGPVFSAKNDGIALRSCRSILKDVERPDDFKVLRVSAYETDNCSLSPEAEPVEVLMLSEVEEVL